MLIHSRTSVALLQMDTSYLPMVFLNLGVNCTAEMAKLNSQQGKHREFVKMYKTLGKQAKTLYWHWQGQCRGCLSILNSTVHQFQLRILAELGCMYDFYLETNGNNHREKFIVSQGKCREFENKIFVDTLSIRNIDFILENNAKATTFHYIFYTSYMNIPTYQLSKSNA